MTNVNVIENKISSIFKYLKQLEAFKKYSQAEIEKEPFLKGALERYLYLVTQASIDLAEALISFKRFRKPTTYSECFDILFEEGILEREFSESLVKMAKFRNTIAHDYENLDFGIIYDVLKNRLKDISDFVRVVEGSVGL